VTQHWTEQEVAKLSEAQIEELTKAIAKTSRFNQSQVRSVLRISQSVDMTLAALEYACGFNLDPKAAFLEIKGGKPRE